MLLATTRLRQRSRFAALALLVLLLTLLATAAVQWRLRDEALARQFAVARLTVRALEEQLTQSLNVVERSLLLCGSSEQGSRPLAMCLQQAPYLRSLSLLDAGGRVRASSHAANLGVRVARSLFTPGSSAPLNVLRSGPLLQGRDLADSVLGAGRPPAGLSFIPLWLDVPRAGGRWLPVLATLNTDYFLNYYSNHLQAGQGEVALLRYDGSLLISTAAKPWHSRLLAARLAQTEADSYVEHAADGRHVLTAYRASRVYPFVLVLHLDEAQALAAWREEALHTTLAVTAALLVLLGLAGAYFLRAERLAQARQRDEADLRIAATAFDAQEGMFVTDTCGVILRVNRAFSDITGYSAQEAVGHTPSLLSSGRHGPAFYAGLWHQLLSHGSWHGELWNRRKNGDIYPQWLTVTAVQDEAGEVSHYVATLTDITQRKAAEQEIQRLAYYDPLTRLPNRRLLLQRLQQVLADDLRAEGALLFIDLDNFKTLNDTLGHDHGDLLLQQVAQRLQQGVADSDTVARLGGDEFVVLLPGLEADTAVAARQAQRVGERLRLALNAPYDLAGHDYSCSPSIGISLFGDGLREGDELMKRADLALYSAKAAGRNAVRFFDQQLQQRVDERARLEAALRSMLSEGQLSLHYQPQHDAAGQLAGAEALLRWQDSALGDMPPERFLPLAEETGLIVPLGWWVLQQACRQLHAWSAQPATASLSLAVNVSASQLRQPDFPAQLHALLQDSAAPPQRLVLELTESVLMDDVAAGRDKIAAIRRLGVQFALDDFGTGYSSLAHLKTLPLDQLKLDRSFVHGMLYDRRDAAIVQAVLQLAQTLQLSVVAEGVETPAQHASLLAGGCQYFQGYLFGPALPLADFEALAGV